MVLPILTILDWKGELDEVRDGEIILIIVGFVLTLILIGIFFFIWRMASREE